MGIAAPIQMYLYWLFIYLCIHAFFYIFLNIFISIYLILDTFFKLTAVH